MKTRLMIILLLMTPIMANFNFGKCIGSGTFEQEIKHYSEDYENTAFVGTIPAGIEGLRIDLISDKDVDIRLYGVNEDKIVHWPYGILQKSFAEIKVYQDVNVSYSGYNGVDGQKGHEFIEVEGATPTVMTMKAFGYEQGYATVNYSWTGKVDCTQEESGEGNFTQSIEENTTNLVGTIPPNVNNIQINLTSNNDIDIQLYGEDGTAIVSWNPEGLLSQDSMQSIIYHDMNITWSGYLGINGHSGDEYINITPQTTESLTMKVYGYQSGTANVSYTWGEEEVIPQGEELIHNAGNELGPIDKSTYWLTYGEGWGIQTRSYNNMLFLYSTNKENGAGIYQKFETEIGREYEVKAILLGTDTNKEEEWNGQSFVTISKEIPQINGKYIIAESIHVSGGSEVEIKFRFKAQSSISYLAIRSSGVWLYANARAISVKAIDNEPVDDKTPPIITMYGFDTSVVVDTQYTDKGATAIDNIDGNISNSIQTTSDINISQIGVYHVYYDVNDSAGNSAIQVIREVTVTGENQKPKNNEVHIVGSSVKYVTIQDAIAAASSGDTLLIENGIYEAGIRIDKNLILHNADGAKNVMLTGEKPITEWEYDSVKELYMAASPCTDVQMLFINGVEKKAARYPNDGYFIVDDAPSKSKFSLLNFTMTNDDMKDSVAHVRMSQWRLASRRVQSYEDNYINLVSEAISDSSTITPQFKIFFTQVISAIDSNDEWAWNNNKIYMKSSDTPQNVTVACSEYGIYLDTNAKDVEINGLKITKIKGHGIENKGDTRKTENDDLIIKNNTISYVSGWGIYVRDFYKRYERLPADTILQGNEIHHARTGGIHIFADNALIDSNTIHDIGASKIDDDVLSYGDSNMLSGIYVKNSSGAKVSNNRLNNIGYNGISLSNAWSNWMSNGDRIVENNYITNAVLALNDGACIYTYTGKDHDIESEDREPERDTIRNNIMENCIGSFEGTNHVDTSHRAGEGIYLDNDSSYIDIYNNTVISATKSLFLNYAFEVNTQNNTFILPDTVSIYLRKPGQESGRSANRNILDNKIISEDKLTYKIIFYESGEEYLTNTNKNVIRVKTGTDLNIRKGYGTTPNISLLQWHDFGFDIDSPIIQDSTKPVVLINPSLMSLEFSHLEGCRKFNNTLLDLSSVFVKPYQSLILFGCINYVPATYSESK